jgi:serine protease Do
MKKLMPILTLALLVLPVLPAQADETSTAMQQVADRVGGALAVVRCQVKLDTGTQAMGGMAVCLDKSGLLMTQAIDPRVNPDTITNLEVVIPGVGGKTLSARLLGIDPLTGLSFVKAEGSHPWQVVAFQKSSGTAPGKQVVSVGLALQDPAAPLAVGAGYVSTELRTPSRQVWVTGGMLTAPGSVVLDTAGRAIGLVMGQPMLRYMAPSRQGGLNMALQGLDQAVAYTPVEEFVYILQRIPQDGKVRRLPWIGVGRFQAVSEVEAQANNINTPAVRVDEIIPGHAADKAGLKNRDIVVAHNGQPLEKLATPDLIASEFVRELMKQGTGQDVTLTVIRNGSRQDVKVSLAATPELPNEAPRLFNRQLGLLLREKVMLDQHLDKSPTANVPGMYVVGVGQRSPAAIAGLQAGDLVTAINGQPVGKAEQAGQLIDSFLQQNPPPDLQVSIQRGADTQMIVIRPPAGR